MGGPWCSLSSTPPLRLLPLTPPPHPHPSGSRLPYMVTARLPAPGRPPRPPPPPDTAPALLAPRAARAPPWRTWVSGPWIPESPASHHCLDALPHPRAPVSSYPCLLAPAFSLCPRFLSDSTSPFPAAPFLPFLGWPLPPFFPRWAPSVRASEDGQGGAVPAGAWTQRLWEGRGFGSRDWDSRWEERV